jgi:hypothetical protein
VISALAKRAHPHEGLSLVKTADQKRIDEEFYAKYDKLITQDKEVVAKSTKIMSLFGLFIGFQAILIFGLKETVDALPNANTYKIILGVMDVLVACYIVRFVVKNRTSL